MAKIPTPFNILPNCEFCFYYVWKNMSDREIRFMRHPELAEACKTCVNRSKFEAGCPVCLFLDYTFSGKHPVCIECRKGRRDLFELNIYKPVEQVLKEIRMENYR